MTEMSDASHPHRASLAAAWAEALGTAFGAFDRDGTTLVPRDDLAAVIVVELGDAMVVAAPSAALDALAGRDRATLLGAAAVSAALPDSRPLGSAHLLIAGARPPAPTHPVVAADDRAVQLFRERGARARLRSLGGDRRGARGDRPTARAAVAMPTRAHRIAAARRAARLRPGRRAGGGGAARP